MCRSPSGNAEAECLEITVRTLESFGPDHLVSEILLRGDDDRVDEINVRWLPLELSVGQSQDNPLDADGSGQVTAADALVVINFLSEHGPLELDQLADLIADGRLEGEATSANLMARMRRYDTNKSGMVSALDALVVINTLEQLKTAKATAEAELVGPISVAESALEEVAKSGLEEDDDQDEGLLF